MEYQSIHIQGNIVSTEILDKIRTEDIKFQQAADFGLDPKSTVREEIGVAWSATRAHYAAFRLRADRLKEGESGVSETRASWIIPLLQQLGYTVEKAPAFIHPDTKKSYAISHRASNLGGFPIHIMGINDDLDKRRENGGPRLSPHALVQEYLNNDEHTYALVTNGGFLRLLRDATRLVRLSYLEFDLKKMMEEELYSDFALMFRLLHATRMPKQPDVVEDSIIEFYHQESLASGSRIRERLSTAVESSIKVLANGFLQHPANEALREQIRGKRMSSADYYQLQLRLIYRLLFLIVTEERHLVYPETRDPDIQRKRKIYYDYYSIERLRKLAVKIHYVDRRKHDLWEGLKSTFLLFEEDVFAEKLGIKPLGSGLFAPGAMGLLPQCKLDNDTLLRVIRHLTLFENDQKQLVRVNYSDLDVEEFGSVYEGLLEYDAAINDQTGQLIFTFVQGTGRSSSGSHYTPEELVKPLIKHSLDYVIEDKLKEADKEKALLSIKVCDVACGSGHILLSAARRIAIEVARVRTHEDQPTPTSMRSAIRDVIKSCIYGVDKNPLAVELCKVALWLEAHNPGDPLNFLDHHIKCGDSIVGLAHKEELAKGIPDEAFKTTPSDDRDVASSFRKRNKQEREGRQQRALPFDQKVNQQLVDVLKVFEKFNSMPERTPHEIAAKEVAYKKLTDGPNWWRLKKLADLQVAQFFIPKTRDKQHVITTDGIYYEYLRGERLQEDARGVAEAVTESTQRHFFHWFLEFPEVSAQGGYDCIVGNPPFLGGKKIGGNHGERYVDVLHHYFPGVGGQSDILAYFVRRIWSLLCPRGFLSIIATNSIREGDTREGSLEVIENEGGSIIFAQRSIRWPGHAKLFVTPVAVTNHHFSGNKFLDGRTVARISPLLEDDAIVGKPYRLTSNSSLMYRGVDFGCEGFILSRNEVTNLIRHNRKNVRVISYLQNGEDTNTSPQQLPGRYILNFHDWNEAQVQTYPEPYRIALERVKPFRLTEEGADKWWQYHRRRGELYQVLSEKQCCLITAFTTRHLSFTIAKPNRVFTNALNVLVDGSFGMFAILQSSVHNIWAWKYASRLKNDLRYTPSDCFETFPFPANDRTIVTSLETVGRELYEYRRALMRLTSTGLTKIYNQYHDPKIAKLALAGSSANGPDTPLVPGLCGPLGQAQPLRGESATPAAGEVLQMISKLRDLHVRVDRAVAEAYGWGSVDLCHGFYEVDTLPENDRVRYTVQPDARREILSLLFELNHRISKEDQRPSQTIITRFVTNTNSTDELNNGTETLF